MRAPESILLDDAPLEFQDWGLVGYEDALDRQLALVEDVASSGRAGLLAFCSHPPVVTRGRSTQPGDVFAWQGPTIEVARGGRATYHGPSQLVIYPILNLKLARRGRGPHEIGGYLRALENSLIEWLAGHGIEAEGRSLRKKSSDAGAAEETGVWTKDGLKIASLGIGVKKWVAYHGAALNLDHDPAAFEGMLPCGFQKSVMTSVEEKLGLRLDRTQVVSELRTRLLSSL